MSIVRVSAHKGAIHGLGPEGLFVHEPYVRRSRLGRTEEFWEPDSAAGGEGQIRPGVTVTNAQELDRRGFPRLTSLFTHMMQNLLNPAMANTGADQPVMVMVHGFLFDPTQTPSRNPAGSDNPHSRVYHFVRGDEGDEIRHHTGSWPLGFGFAPDDVTGKDGMAVAFGWGSSPGFASSLISHFQNFYARAYERAAEAAWNLLTVLHEMNLALPDGRRIDLVCHSLGSRVVVRAIAMAAKHGRIDLLARLDRVIIMGGAEYVVEAQVMLKHLLALEEQDKSHPAGDFRFEAKNISFYNIVSRENDVLDVLGENFGPRTFGNGNVIGHNGLDVEDPKSLAGTSWLDFQIDSPKLQQFMSKRGIEISGDRPGNVWDHWYYYTFRGNMALYRSILRERGDWSIAALRAAEMPDKVSRRRSVFGD